MLKTMAVPLHIPLYWHCQHCNAQHQLLPGARPRKYCNVRCRKAAYYQRKKTEG